MPIRRAVNSARETPPKSKPAEAEEAKPGAASRSLKASSRTPSLGLPGGGGRDMGVETGWAAPSHSSPGLVLPGRVRNGPCGAGQPPGGPFPLAPGSRDGQMATGQTQFQILSLFTPLQRAYLAELF